MIFYIITGFALVNLFLCFALAIYCAWNNN